MFTKYINPRWLIVASLLAVISAMTLFIVWPFPHTIAARNIAIALGSLSSVFFLLGLSRSEFKKSDFVVPLLLLSVPAWLWILYWLNPIDPTYQMKELSGTWVRIIALIFFGFILGRMIVAYSFFQPYLITSLLFVPLIVPIVFHLRIPLGIGVDLYPGFFKTKSAGAYYVMYAYLIAFAGLAYSLFKEQLKKLPIFFYLMVIMICVYDFYLLKSFNAILWAVCFFMAFLCLLFLSFIRWSSQISIRLKLLVMTVVTMTIVVMVFGYLKYDSKFDQKVQHLRKDILISLNLEQNKTWQRGSDTRYISDPTDSGRVINMSTYERVSWFLKGFQILIANPFGTGDAYFSFGRYMRLEYLGTYVKQTHSGWLDFALGVGVPGLLAIWGCILMLLNMALVSLKKANQQPIAFACLSVVGGVFITYITTELSDRELLEQYFFILAIFSGALVKKA